MTDRTINRWPRRLLALTFALAFAATAGASNAAASDPGASRLDTSEVEAGATAPAGEAGVQVAREIRLRVLGMSCPFCAYGVEQKLKKLDGVESLDIDLESGIATLVMDEQADVSNEILRKTVKDAGFETDAISRDFDSEYEDWNPEAIDGSNS